MSTQSISLSIQVYDEIPEPILPNPPVRAISPEYDEILSLLASIIKPFDSFLYPVYASPPDKLTLALASGILEQRVPFRNKIVRRGLKAASTAHIHLKEMIQECEWARAEGRWSVPHQRWAAMIRDASELKEELEEVRHGLDQIVATLEHVARCPATQKSSPIRNCWIFSLGLMKRVWRTIKHRVATLRQKFSYGYVDSQETRPSRPETANARSLRDSHLMPLLRQLKDLQHILLRLSRHMKLYIATLKSLQERSGEGVSDKDDGVYDGTGEKFQRSANPGTILTALKQGSEILLRFSFDGERLL
ncbi:hypothetical protein BC938DRAFT_482133 [Jimgerdemannia flammicorona]|uniref:Uncharacterized protein n=1 Tax=Jimgerdemannia flammicorona TaxID=994334 RepID=A0A433QEH9_9FUNG|nr:hypothetical protein BC938DRAFT_482133 [Jimgerdemannia flammicorona]